MFHIPEAWLRESSVITLGPACLIYTLVLPPRAHLFVAQESFCF